jgi:signal transduction histidine kinase
MLAFLMFNRRRHMKQLNKAYQHALESDNLKSAFIRNVSHEIRTPLNIISGFAQVMSDPQLDASSEERRHMTKMMQTNTNIITALIDEMLELSQNESGGEVCRDDTVRVNALLRELIHSESQNLTPDTTIRLDTSLSDAFTMRTNQSMLRRIVGALLNNAIKYTDQGTITLKASEGGGQLTLIVEDTGRGVPSNESEHIFDRFVKLDSFKVGIGLGLPLCRSNARKLGGSVMLDTTFAGPGARFIVTLPLEMEPDQEDEEENE